MPSKRLAKGTAGTSPWHSVLQDVVTFPIVDESSPTQSDDRLVRTRSTLAVVATHIVARARYQATGRFGLRVTPGGFATPEFGEQPTRVRVVDGILVYESGAATGATTRSAPIDGRSLRDLADLVGVDLATELSVGHDTPPLGDVDAPLDVELAAASRLGEFFQVVSRSLDQVIGRLPDEASPSMVQLWPEHFDVAVDVDADPTRGRRVNLGGSPGDGFHREPYLYVGPWDEQRPGDPSFWNAPFGAVLTAGQLDTSADQVVAAVGFFSAGLNALSQ